MSITENSHCPNVKKVSKYVSIMDKLHLKSRGEKCLVEMY